MTFRIEYPKRSKSIKSFDAAIRRRILDKISELGENRFPSGLIKLHGESHIYRLRVGDYRILYEVYAQQHIILIVKIEHRGTVYGP